MDRVNREFNYGEAVSVPHPVGKFSVTEFPRPGAPGGNRSSQLGTGRQKKGSLHEQTLTYPKEHVRKDPSLISAKSEAGAPLNARKVPWTAEEDQILRDVFPEGGIRKAMAALPGRNRKAIYTRVHRFGIRNNLWTAKRGLPRDTDINLKPKHCRDIPECSIEWWMVQQRAFAKAMRDNPDERPIDYAQLENGAGSRR